MPLLDTGYWILDQIELTVEGLLLSGIQHQASSIFKKRNPL